MPDLTTSQILLLISVGLFTLAAAMSDFRTRRIPNKLTVPMFVAGLVYQATFYRLDGLADAGMAFAVGFGTLFVLWMIGGGGGGDVKLMGALSVWLGFRMTILVMIVSTVFVLAGTLGVFVWSVLRRGPWKTKKKFVAQSDPRKETLPERQKRRLMAYAIPVALATWVVVIWKIPQLP